MTSNLSHATNDIAIATAEIINNTSYIFITSSIIRRVYFARRKLKRVCISTNPLWDLVPEENLPHSTKEEFFTKPA